jgi:hypothetical protein
MPGTELYCLACSAWLYRTDVVHTSVTNRALITRVPKQGLKIRLIDHPIRQLVAECYACGSQTPVPDRSLGRRVRES